MRGSDDGRAFFAESKTNFTEGIFQMIASELPGSSWRILSYRKKYWEWIPTAPTGVERQSFASSVQGSVKADEVGLGLGLGFIIGLVAGS